MAFAPSSPVSGGAQTGFTSPTYTLVADNAPDVNARQWAVTAVGGTQTGVTTHSMSSPFTATWFRPRAYRPLGKPHPVTGQLTSVPFNRHKLKVRKGMTPLSGQPTVVGEADATFSLPAGSDTADPANVRGMTSLFVGLLSQQSAGAGDTLVTGIV